MQPYDLVRHLTRGNGISQTMTGFFGLVSWLALAAGSQTPALPHFFKVNDHVYRGAQPAEDGWSTLARMGVTVVIDLRREGEDGEHSTSAERKAVEAAGMRYVHIPMTGSAPTDEEISKALAVLESQQTVFVHCQGGKDRTGTVIACYRIVHDGWTNRQAVEEAVSLGLHRIKLGMRRYIENYRRHDANPNPE
jgi:uncharacterized protein (TIGR01244 family)